MHLCATCLLDIDTVAAGHTAHAAKEQRSALVGGAPLNADSTAAFADDVAGVSLWPMSDATTTAWRFAVDLTIYLHATPNITTDPNPVMCTEGLDLLTAYELYSQCPPATGTRYGEHQLQQSGVCRQEGHVHVPGGPSTSHVVCATRARACGLCLTQVNL